MEAKTIQCCRIVFADGLEHAFSSARAPEGRFHRSGEEALYLSLTQEGAEVAVNYYRRPDDAERLVVPIEITGGRLLHFEDAAVRSEYGLDLLHVAARWQKERDKGLEASTWKAADVARHADADGIFYPSRNRPNLTHLTLFRWNVSGAPQLRQSGDPFLAYS